LPEISAEIQVFSAFCWRKEKEKDSEVLNNMSDVPGILFSSLGGDVTSYRQLLSHPKVVASLHNYGIAVVRGAQKYVHPCI
jgi:hypothetical protein